VNAIAVDPGSGASIDLDDALVTSYFAVDVSLQADDGDAAHSVTSLLRAKPTSLTRSPLQKGTKMNTHLVKRLALLAAGTLASSGLGLAASPADADTPRTAHQQRAGTKSLAQVLAADGTKLDHNWQDFDILEAAVLAVIAAKPDSPVALLTDGSVRLTAFLPTDQAFRDLVGDLTGKRPGTEKKTVNALLKIADVNTIETVLLYHVVPGATLASPKVIAAAKKGTKLKTAQGRKVKVLNRKGNITLIDKDPDFANPTVILNGIDINRGNKQIGHAIDRVLLPLNL